VFVGAATCKACNKRIFPHAPVHLDQEIGRIPAIIIWKANDLALSEGLSFIPGARQSFLRSQMQYRKEQTILRQNGVQPVIIILISKNNFDVIVLLCCYAL
jgi:hypothetical protein